MLAVRSISELETEIFGGTSDLKTSNRVLRSGVRDDDPCVLIDRGFPAGTVLVDMAPVWAGRAGPSDFWVLVRQFKTASDRL